MMDTAVILRETEDKFLKLIDDFIGVDGRRESELAEHESFQLLENNPFFALSQWSRERFHSSMWAWMINYDHRFASLFFDEIETSKIERAVTEENDRDITIWVLGEGIRRAYVIENKFKSLYSVSQLNRYEKALMIEKGVEFVAGLVMGIANPKCNDIPRNWGYLTYNDLHTKLDKKISECNYRAKTRFEDSLIVEYSEFLLHIVTAIGGALVSLQDRIITDNNAPPLLRQCHLDSIGKKIQADNFCRKVEHCGEVVAMRSNLRDAKLVCDTDYFNNEAIVTFKLESHRKINDEPLLMLGVQIQGQQFRKIGAVFGKAPEDEFDFFHRNGWFEDRIKRMSTRGRPPGRFASFEDSFIYQHAVIPSKKFNELEEAVCKDLRNAAILFSKLIQKLI